MSCEGCSTGKRYTNSSFSDLSPIRYLKLPTISFKWEFICSVMDCETGMLAKAAPSSKKGKHCESAFHSFEFRAAVKCFTQSRTTMNSTVAVVPS